MFNHCKESELFPSPSTFTFPNIGLIHLRRRIFPQLTRGTSKCFFFFFKIPILHYSNELRDRFRFRIVVMSPRYWTPCNMHLILLSLLLSLFVIVWNAHVLLCTDVSNTPGARVRCARPFVFMSFSAKMIWDWNLQRPVFYVSHEIVTRITWRDLHKRPIKQQIQE